MFQELLKKEKELSHELMTNFLTISKECYDFTTITSCVFHRIIVTHILKKIHAGNNIDILLNFNFKNKAWQRELAIYLYYNTEFIIKKALFNKNNIFNCYFLNPKITMDFIDFTNNDPLLKYKIKDFEKLKDVNFQNIDQEKLAQMIKLAGTSKGGAYYDEQIIKKCLKMDYITGYYFVNLYGYSQQYYFIHKTLKTILLKLKIKQLENKIETLEIENKMLHEHIKYMPEGDGYLQAKNNFNSLKDIVT